MRVEPGKPIYDSPTFEDGHISRGANRSVVALVACLVAVMLGVAVFGGAGDEETAAASTTVPSTSGADDDPSKPTSATVDESSTTTTAPDRPAEIDSDWTVPSTGWFVDASSRLVRIDLADGSITRISLNGTDVNDLAVVAGMVLVQGKPFSYLVDPNSSALTPVVGEPIAWDDQAVWTASTSVDGGLRFIAQIPGAEPRMISGTTGYVNSVHAAEGALYADGPNGVWRFDSSGVVEEVESLVVAGRAGTTVRWNCSLNECLLVVDFADGTSQTLPAGSEIDELTISSSGRYLIGGGRPVGWLMQAGQTQTSAIDQARPLVWMTGQDLLVSLDRDELVFRSPDRSETYTSKVPAGLRSDLLLVLTDG